MGGGGAGYGLDEDLKEHAASPGRRGGSRRSPSPPERRGRDERPRGAAADSGGFGLDAELGGGRSERRPGGVAPLRGRERGDDEDRSSRLDDRKPRGLSERDPNRPRGAYGLDAEIKPDRHDEQRVSWKQNSLSPRGRRSPSPTRRRDDDDRRSGRRDVGYGLEAELGEGRDDGFEIRSRGIASSQHDRGDSSKPRRPSALDTSEEALGRAIKNANVNKNVSVHIIGQIVGATGFSGKTTYCTYQVFTGADWKLRGGQMAGQTVAGTPQPDSEFSVMSHPLDLAYETASVQGWPKIVIKVFNRSVFYGTSTFLAYGVAHLPITPGSHSIRVQTWRPNDRDQRVKDEIMGFFTGLVPQLVNENFVHTRSNAFSTSLLTVGAGTVHVDINVMVRNFEAAHLGGNSMQHAEDKLRESHEKTLKRSQDIEAAFYQKSSGMGADEEESEGLRMVREGRASRLGAYDRGRRGGGTPATRDRSDRDGFGLEAEVSRSERTPGVRSPRAGSATATPGKRNMEERRKRMKEMEQEIERKKAERASRLGSTGSSRRQGSDESQDTTGRKKKFGLDAEPDLKDQDRKGGGGGGGFGLDAEPDVAGRERGGGSGRDRRGDEGERRASGGGGGAGFGLDSELDAPAKRKDEEALPPARRSSRDRERSLSPPPRRRSPSPARDKGKAAAAPAFGLDADIEEEILAEETPAAARARSPPRDRDEKKGGGGGFGLDAELS